MGRQWPVMREYVRVCKGSRLSLGPCGVTVEATRQWLFVECSKGCVYVYTPPLLLAYHALYNVEYDNHIQNTPKIVIGLLKLRVRRQNPPFGSAPPRVNRVRDKEIQGVTSSRHTRGPIEGTRHPQTLYLSPD
jgi:hypothetical protein